MVHKSREKGRATAIASALAVEAWTATGGALERSNASRTINASLVERRRSIDRRHNARRSWGIFRLDKERRAGE
jgi:hypothetical protein